MAEPTEYKKPSTKPKTRISTTSRTGFVSDEGRSQENPQYVANTRTGGSAFTAPTSGSGSTGSVAGRGVINDATGQTGMAAASPTFSASGTGQTGNTSSNEHLYGFAGDHFTFKDLPTLWANPWLIVNAALDDRNRGGDRLKEEMRGYGEYGLPLFTMLHGLTDDPSDLSSAATINWISRWVNSMTSQGGNVPGYEQLLGNLLAARGDDTILGEALNAGTAQDQIGTFMTYLRAALGANNGNPIGGTINPIASGAILSQANREADKFLEGTTGENGYARNFTDWLNSGGHRLFGGA